MLTSPVTSLMGLLSDLVLFHINYNRFCGSVPKMFERMKLLHELDLSNNRFVGKFPRVVLSLPSLKYLDLRFNEFEGPIPSQLFDKDLDAVFLNDNRFRFGIPENLRNSQVSVLILANNDLGGCIPGSFGGRAKTLNELILLNDNLTGCGQIGLLDQLTIFDTSFNNISGPLPTSIGRLKSLEQLDVAHNGGDLASNSDGRKNCSPGKANRRSHWNARQRPLIQLTAASLNVTQRRSQLCPHLQQFPHCLGLQGHHRPLPGWSLHHSQGHIHHLLHQRRKCPRCDTLPTATSIHSPSKSPGHLQHPWNPPPSSPRDVSHSTPPPPPTEKVSPVGRPAPPPMPPTTPEHGHTPPSSLSPPIGYHHWLSLPPPLPAQHEDHPLPLLPPSPKQHWHSSPPASTSPPPPQYPRPIQPPPDRHQEWTSPPPPKQQWGSTLPPLQSPVPLTQHTYPTPPPPPTEHEAHPPSPPTRESHPQPPPHATQLHAPPQSGCPFPGSPLSPPSVEAPSNPPPVHQDYQTPSPSKRAEPPKPSLASPQPLSEGFIPPVTAVPYASPPPSAVPYY
ncbi:hypothetical protein MLD38_018784 [Melastoma candidum]|uniref:Uncharacterized protein n=1 Tax=Melastoma candidum TaxID=119954 RepID=A0ACB9QVF6_9MYRT|nr:hypothetical protein MLD38_018784 [Melastoma candidum]